MRELVRWRGGAGSLGESEAKANRTLTLCKLPAVLTFVTKGANPSSITWNV